MADGAQHLAHIKQLMKSMWTSGDFGKLAELMEKSAEDFVARLNLKPGMRVLDVGCGTGNQSIPAAQAGAEVTGVDIAPNLLAQAAERAKREGLNIDFREGDAEELPFTDGSFDVALSMFAAMFAPRPEMVGSEFVRVCRPGGLIAMGNWTPDSFIAKQTAIGAKFVPPPPGASNPFDWGDERIVRERFGDGAEVTCTRRPFIFDLPLAPEVAEEYFRLHLGPMQVIQSRLDESGRQQFAEALRDLWVRENQGDESHTVIPTEYLEVHARRK
jgi:SAM-dependent methyltransferase